MADPLGSLVDLVFEVRPEWDPGLVRLVLVAHKDQCNFGDLSIAALRAARTPEVRTPKAIGWRGPHWDGLATKPLHVEHRERCAVCGKTEPRCMFERPGPDDHPFEPTTNATMLRFVR